MSYSRVVFKSVSCQLQLFLLGLRIISVKLEAGIIFFSLVLVFAEYFG